ncbi:MAG: ParB/RepB/Spo0J family partition protein [Anaerolineae bacterium]|nr:ParB/RepB/Spo0J family partition protein [Anaerolineae bacterium]
MTRRKSGLGKGLDALIPAEEEAPVAATAPGVIQVPLSAITPNPHQPRSPIRDQDLVELAASIEEHGVIQPLIVAQAAGGYQLIAGERRWRASRLAGLSQVPVLVKEAAPKEMLELALVENVQRSDLNALEEAQAYRQLMEEFDLTQEQVAKRVGKSRTAVANTLRLLNASRAVQQALLEDKLSEGHARALLGLEKAEAQENALAVVQNKGLNVRQTEDLVRRRLGEKEKPKHKPSRKAQSRREETKALEDDFRSALDTKVELTRDGEGGRLVIHFYSDEELDALYERIVGGK